MAPKGWCQCPSTASSSRAVGYLLAWLTSEENAHLCGQVVFIDGGSDVIIRGESTW
jgi:hypothetical protein